MSVFLTHNQAIYLPLYNRGDGHARNVIFRTVKKGYYKDWVVVPIPNTDTYVEGSIDNLTPSLAYLYKPNMQGEIFYPITRWVFISPTGDVHSYTCRPNKDGSTPVVTYCSTISAMDIEAGLDYIRTSLDYVDDIFYYKAFHKDSFESIHTVLQNIALSTRIGFIKVEIIYWKQFYNEVFDNKPGASFYVDRNVLQCGGGKYFQLIK